MQQCSAGERSGGVPDLRGLVACVVVCHADVNGAIVVQVVEHQVGGLGPQGSVKGDGDGRLQSSQ